MNLRAQSSGVDKTLKRLHAAGWGSHAAVSLFLDRCQVDTPSDLVRRVWKHVYQCRRRPVGKVVDFGAGDGRFAKNQEYQQYVGFEVDTKRFASSSLPRRASILCQCAFSQEIKDADVCIGNPPYVRNQDLPTGWRQQAADSLFKRTAVRLSGLANAWQYFFLLGLVSTKPDGLVALVIPYEWVSRPSCDVLREYIREHGWDVRVYRLRDETFNRVLTTSSITVVDKRSTTGIWQYFEEESEGGFRALPSETGSSRGVVQYLRRTKMRAAKCFASRGLSPGTQRVLTLTEGERVRAGLRVGWDVVPCVTTLRNLDQTCTAVTAKVFKDRYQLTGLKCWLIRTDRTPGPRLERYLSSVPSSAHRTATCMKRESWWKFTMPEVPPLLAATGFRTERPKIVSNCIAARAVGSVSGIYGVRRGKRRALIDEFQKLNLSKRIVPHSNGLRKIEIHQMNALLEELSKKER
jgi:methylase of polypeptide subunit release factors